MSNTMQQTVPAGCTTGVFYLILAGLSFGINWKDLMDYASKHNLDIEYAAVYPKLGGWLRVLDRQTFLRAFEVFSHAEIKGKPILADSRNDKAPVMLRFPPPPIRQKLSLSSHYYNQNSQKSSSPNDLSAYKVDAVLCRQLSPVDVPLYWVPTILVPVYSYNMREQAASPQSNSFAQIQHLVETPVDILDGHGGQVIPATASPNYRAASARNALSLEQAPPYNTTLEVRGKQRAMTLEALPDRETSRTPVVVNGSRTSRGHRPRNSY